MPLSLIVSRRHFFFLIGGGAVLAAGTRSVAAAETRIGRLIVESRGKGTISQKIDFISSALRGTRYQSDTLIGGPWRSEKFVVRDDAFDCVTFCETVLAASIATNRSEFDSVLRTVRYHNGIVAWGERNHYFFEWCQHNVENNTCRWIPIVGAVDIEKTVDSQKGISKRRFAMRVIPSSVFLANRNKLERGDIVGFVSRQPNLDFFHTGFIAFGKTGALLLRHASKSRHRVLDERIEQFVTANGVRYVSLLRPQEPRAIV
jgi:hypothetical protein